MESVLGNTRKVDITFWKSGRIDLSARISKILSLSKGDVIDIMLDDEECYLYVRHRKAVGRHKGMVYNQNKRGHHMRVWNKQLSQTVMGASTQERHRLSVGEMVELPSVGKALPIIIKHILP